MKSQSAIHYRIPHLLQIWPLSSDPVWWANQKRCYYALLTGLPTQASKFCTPDDLNFLLKREYLPDQPDFLDCMQPEPNNYVCLIL